MKKHKRKVKSSNKHLSDTKNLVLKNTVALTVEIMKAGIKNKNNVIYDLTTCKRIVENINLMKHEIHSDASEEGGTGVVVGRTILATISQKGTVKVTAEIEKSIFKGKNTDAFTLSPVGIGAVNKTIVVDYDFSCLFVCLKSESSFFRDGLLIKK